jgi:ribosomal protein S24E
MKVVIKYRREKYGKIKKKWLLHAEEIEARGNKIENKYQIQRKT